MKEVKKVLSIDLDYIMEPCIQLYNRGDHIIRDIGINPDKLSYEEFWGVLNEDLYIDEFLSYNEEKLAHIIDVIFEVCKDIPKENIYVGMEHDAILTFLCQDKAKENEVFEVYNIDHHHDLFYSSKQLEEVERFNFANLACWVWYLLVNEKLSAYYWISNDRSTPFEMKNLPEEIKDFKKYKLEDLADIKFDYLFICRSNHFFPYKFRAIFDVLIKKIEEVFDTTIVIDDQPYCKDGKSRWPIGTMVEREEEITDGNED